MLALEVGGVVQRWWQVDLLGADDSGLNVVVPNEVILNDDHEGDDEWWPSTFRHSAQSARVK